MSYKFQTGPALMAGKLVQSGSLEVRDKDDGTLRYQINTDSGAVSGSGTLYQAGAATFSSTIAATGSITAGSSFIIGSADLNETDMEKLDGITDGTGAANKCMVLDASGEIASVTKLSATDLVGTNIDGIIGADTARAGTFAALVGTTATFSSTLAANGDVDLGNAVSDTVTVTGRFDSDLVPSSDSARDLGTAALQWADAHIDAGYIDAVSGSSTLQMGGAAVLGSTLNVTGAISGAVAATAASFTCDGSVTAGLSFIIGSANLNETDMEKLDGITNGTVAAAKAVVADGNLDFSGYRNISGSGTLQAVGNSIFGGTLGVSGASTLAGVTLDSLTATANLDIGAYSLRATQFTSDIADGTAPFVVTSTTVVTNLNADNLDGTTWAAPGTIGGTTPGAGNFAALDATGATTLNGTVTLGNATGDDITVTGRLASDVVPKTDSAYDLGTAALQFADAHIDTGYIEAISGSSTLQMVGAATFCGALNVTGAVTAASTITTTGLLSSSVGAQFVGNSVFGGTFNVSGNATFAEDVTVGNAVGDALTVNAGEVEFAANLQETFAVANDSMYWLDATDGKLKSASWSSIMTSTAGTGVTATNGVLSVDQSGGDRVSIGSFGDENKDMVVGLNYGTTTLSQDRTVQLPAAPSTGDIVIVKAPSLAGFTLTVARQGTHLIDGATSVDLESNGGALSVCYVDTNKWKIY